MPQAANVAVFRWRAGRCSDMIARMASTVTNIAIDCANAYELARFWAEVTGHPLDPEDEPGDDETEIMLPGGPALHFIEVPEPKSAKNRLHLCLRACEQTRARARGAWHLRLGFEGTRRLGLIRTGVRSQALSPDTSRDAEVERLLSLGASLVADRRKPDGWGWVVLADPEGNEFCVLPADSERAALSS